MEEVKSRKPLIVIIIILLLIIVALGAYIYLDKTVLNKEEKTLTTIENVDINLNAMFQISNTLERLDNTFNEVNSSLLGYIYTNKRINVKKFDPQAALFVAIHDDLLATNTPQILNEQQVKNNFESIFGNLLKYEGNSIDVGDYYKITYDSTTGTYSYLLNPSIKNYSAKYISHTIKTVLNEDNLLVNRKVFYIEYNDNTKASIYSSADKKQLIATVSLKKGVLDVEEIIAKYGSKISTYQYTFKQNTVDNYSLSTIEKIKS